MSSTLIVAVAVVLARFLMAGSGLDLGPAAAASAPAALALGTAWGVLSRSRLPYLADAVLLALLVPLRGPLVDLVLSLGPGGVATVHMAALVSLVPVGFALGRHLRPAAHGDGLPCLLLGVAMGEALCLLGAVGWLPGSASGFVVAGVLATLVELGRSRRGEGQPADPGSPAWEGLPLGLGLGLALPVALRLVPAYANAGVHASSELSLALALPALLVALPTWALSGNGAVRRALVVAGALTLAFGLWKLWLGLGTYTNTATLIALTRELRNRANDWPGLTEWHTWMLHLLAWVAAGCGLLAGALNRRATGPLLLGLALGWAAQQRVVFEPLFAPHELLLLGLGAVSVTAAVALTRWGLLLLPALVLPLLLMPGEARLGFESVRRLGEYAVEGFQRTALADVTLYSTGNIDNLSVDGRRAARTAFTGRTPFLTLEQRPRPPEFLRRPDGDDDGELERHYGVRVAGLAAHLEHDPSGEEGSVGRFARLFLRPGRLLLAGVGAELAAADLAAADLAAADLAAADLAASGLANQLVVTSPVPLGQHVSQVLATELGLPPTTGAVGSQPPADLAEFVATGAADTVLLVPERAGWPLAGWGLTESVLRKLRDALTEGGRCLAWVDTAEIDARALGARLAAFAQVFGERCFALVEPRELSAPFVVLVGWRAHAGAPDAEELDLLLPGAQHSGLRPLLLDSSALGFLLLRDGRGMLALTHSHPIHDRGRPVTTRLGAPTGWAAVASLADPTARLSLAVRGAADTGPISQPLLQALTLHEGLFYELERLRGPMLAEPLPDVDWDLFDAEAQLFSVAAEQWADPLVALCLAALLEPLVREGDLTRFAQVFTLASAERLPSWRLALQHAAVLEAGLMHDEAVQARARAAALLADPAGVR